MTLRVVSGQGTAFAFVLVALGFLGLAMLGWRLVDIATSRARSSRAVRGAG
jgi:ABC-type Na+ efflux pump permease subunit